jgi:hypothetical protein
MNTVAGMTTAGVVSELNQQEEGYEGKAATAFYAKYSRFDGVDIRDVSAIIDRLGTEKDPDKIRVLRLLRLLARKDGVLLNEWIRPKQVKLMFPSLLV